jgi:hypothetical protein
MEVNGWSLNGLHHVHLMFEIGLDEVCSERKGTSLGACGFLKVFEMREVLSWNPALFVRMDSESHGSYSSF